MYCLETKALSYRFSKRETALHHIDLKLEEGSIYGFLGPNGAGKTTTLRLILGLLKKQEGEISVFGKSFDKHRQLILGQTGSLIESPSLFSQLTVWENLSVLQKVYQCPASRMNEVLKLVDLLHARDKKAGQLSLGMKQRLSIAMALLPDPKLLILDEPTNGLDPAGIIEIRELLKQLNKERGTTILISSHLLSEIEKLVSHVGVINKGKMLFQGTLQELIRIREASSSIVLDTSNNTAASAILTASQIAHELKDTKILLRHLPKEQVAALNRQLLQHNLDVFEISSLKNDLESVFMDLTKQTDRL